MSFKVTGIVEISKGSTFKYEVDKDTGELTIDRPLKSSIPYNYGFVPNTLYADGDPIDVCIVGDPIFPLTRVKVVIIGALICKDNGVSDDKLVGYVEGDETAKFLSNHLAKSDVAEFLSTYKEGFEVLEWVESKEAQKLYEDSLIRTTNE